MQTGDATLMTARGLRDREGWRCVTNLTGATCRLLNAPYSDESQLYGIDGLILSPNVGMQSVETVALDFAHSDHNPVRLKVKLL